MPNLNYETEGCDKNSNIVMIAKCHRGDASKKNRERRRDKKINNDKACLN